MFGRNCRKLNDKVLIQYSTLVVIMHSDASSSACRGHALCVDSEEFQLFYQALSSIQAKQDSNSRELLAILYGLKSPDHLFKAKMLRFTLIARTRRLSSIRVACLFVCMISH